MHKNPIVLILLSGLVLFGEIVVAEETQAPTPSSSRPEVQPSQQRKENTNLLENVDPQFAFLFKEPTLCGNPVQQVQELFQGLQVIDRNISKLEKCRVLLKTLRESVIKNGMAVVGGCHISTSRALFYPEDIRSCANMSPETKALALNIVTEIKGASNLLHWGLWNIFYAELVGPKTIEGREYLKTAKKAYESYYNNVGGQSADKNFVKVYQLLGEKIPSPNILGYWHTETDRYEFSVDESTSLKGSELIIVKDLMRALSACVPCIGDSQFKYSDPNELKKLYSNDYFQKIFNKDFAVEMDRFVELFLRFKQQNKDYVLRDQLEKQYVEVQTIFEKTILENFKVKKKFIQEY